MKRLLIAISAALAPATFAMAQTTAPASAPATKVAVATPPPYTPVRWTENYAYLKDPTLRTDLFDNQVHPAGRGRLLFIARRPASRAI